MAPRMEGYTFRDLAHRSAALRRATGNVRDAFNNAARLSTYTSRPDTHRSKTLRRVAGYIFRIVAHGKVLTSHHRDLTRAPAVTK